MKPGSIDAADKRGRQEREQGLGEVDESKAARGRRSRRTRAAQAEVAQDTAGAAEARARARARHQRRPRAAAVGRRLGACRALHPPLRARAGARRRTGAGFRSRRAHLGGRREDARAQRHQRRCRRRVRAGASRCPTSRSGARSSASRCAPSAARPPSAWRRRGPRCRTSRRATRPTSPISRQLRQKYAKRVEAAGGKLTITAIALKVVASALKVFPQFNASIDVASEEVVLKKYVHIGVAVDTEAGLLVPVIRDVGPEEHRAALDGAAGAGREGQGAQAVARGDGRRVLHDQQPWRHRRHVLHADRQRAGSGDPRDVALRHGAGLERRRSSCRG